jgi:hypothetical protein
VQSTKRLSRQEVQDLPAPTLALRHAPHARGATSAAEAPPVGTNGGFPRRRPLQMAGTTTAAALEASGGGEGVSRPEAALDSSAATQFGGAAPPPPSGVRTCSPTLCVQLSAAAQSHVLVCT